MTNSSPPRPPKPEKRRSIWSRFSRRGPVTSTDLTVQYTVSAAAPSAGYSKPRFPSPKSGPKPYKARGGHLAHYDEDDYNSAANIRMHRKM
ncbi:hypothetical protein PDJAM_G00056910 [Pangasius djambal]|uniref:Uncharacterized protein n=1 Tax=Pangasius djambal TaxID=1691987 RepID=A0ACC5YXD7_9TELE|nr:hypothetical protein [Pangasius djambal]